MAPEQNNQPDEAILAPKNLRVEPSHPEDPAYQEAQRAHEKEKEGVMGLTKVQLAELKGDLLTTQEEGEASEIESTPEDSPEDTGGAEEGEASETQTTPENTH